MNAQEIIDAIARRIEQTDATGAHSPDEWTDDELMECWNEEQETACELLASTHQNWIVWSQSIALVSGTASYALEPAVDRIFVIEDESQNEIAYDGIQLSSGDVFRDDLDYYDTVAGLVVEGVERVHLEGGNLVWRPTPSGSATRTVKYAPIPPRLHVGTADAGDTNKITLDSNATTRKGELSLVNDYYNHLVIRTTGGTGSGQERTISDYVGSTGVVTVSADWATKPDATTVYALLSPLPRQWWRYTLALATALALGSKGMFKSAQYWEARAEKMLPRLLQRRRQSFQDQPLDLTAGEMEVS